MINNQIGADYDPYVEPTVDDQQPPAAPNQDDPLSDPAEERRYQYWQSKHDKLKKEYEALRSQPAPAPAVQSNQQQAIEKPLKPQKPSNYDPAEAYQPGTTSFQYRSQMDEYTEKYQDWLEYQTSTIETQQRRYAEQVEAQQRLDMTKQEAVYEHGLSPQEADDFVRVMTDPDTMSLGNLVKIYRLLKAPGQNPTPQPQPNQYKGNYMQRPVNSQPPPAAIAGGGGGVSQPSEAESFLAGFRRR
jgi:hypothetical protein